MNVLFDLDGTLTDNFLGISRSINHALVRLGVPPRPDAELRTCVGPPLRESFRRLLATADPTRIEQAIAHYRERFAEAGWRENIAYAGMPELVVRLSGEGHRLWVCTSKPRVFAARIVEHFGLAPCFVAVYGVDLEGSLDTKADLMARLLAGNPDELYAQLVSSG